MSIDSALGAKIANIILFRTQWYSGIVMASGKREESNTQGKAPEQSNSMGEESAIRREKSLRLSSKHTLFVHNEKDVFHLM